MIKLMLPSFLSWSQWLHVFAGMTVFLNTWAFSKSLILALVLTLLVAIVKEVNDHYGYIKFFLTNPKKVKTGFSITDVLATIGLPCIISIIYVLGWVL